MKPAELVLGRTYFRLTFANRDFTMPGVTPLVYVRQFKDNEDRVRYAFQDTVSFVRFGSFLEGAGDVEERFIESVEPESIERSIFTVESIAAEVVAAAQRAAERGYPTLRVLRTGETDAS